LVGLSLMRAREAEYQDQAADLLARGAADRETD
jgi:hypothetical protein